MSPGTDLISCTKALRTRVKKAAKFGFADLTGESMPEVVSSTFREFTPHKPEKHRIDNGKNTGAFDKYEDTVFDYPSIIQSKLGGKWDQYNKLLSAQIGLCNFHCWYCYVPEAVLRGSGAQYLTPQDLVDQFLKIRCARESKSSVLRISGGEPFLAPDLVLDCLEYLERIGLDKEVFLWSETNLSPFLSEEPGGPVLAQIWLQQRGSRLEDLASFRNFALHPCLHGTNPSDFHQTTLAQAEFFDRLVEAFATLVRSRIAIYPTISSNASPSDNLDSLFSKLKAIHPNLPLRFALVTYDFAYPPVNERLTREHRTPTRYDSRSMISKWDELLRKHYGKSYAEIPRKDVGLDDQ
jgi:uncharacterized Fe-S cluster-containing radical SAM superfamily protein